MSDKTPIEWTDATWNPITGCSLVSPGCTNCYAMRLAGSRLKNHWSRKGLTKPTEAGPVWNGQVRFNEKWLDQPLRWSKPRRVFVCAHGDLFHEDIPDTWIDRVFAVMARADKHTFQVLTKRPTRMRDYLLGDWQDRNLPQWGKMTWAGRRAGFEEMTRRLSGPLPNVWLGVSVEDQKRADERIPVLLDTPAAVRFISAEPLLGPVDTSPWIFNRGNSISHMVNGASHAEPRPSGCLRWIPARLGDRRRGVRARSSAHASRLGQVDTRPVLHRRRPVPLQTVGGVDRDRRPTLQINSARPRFYRRMVG